MGIAHPSVPIPDAGLAFASIPCSLEVNVEEFRTLDLYIALALQIVYGIANLVLISLGLAIIFGMMRVINLAHGEFLMLGGYTVVISTNAGVNIWLAMLILAPLVVGIIGVIVERVMIRFLYGRMVDTLLATWGLSLVLIGLVTTIFGAQTATTISPPIGAIQIGDFTSSGYELFLIGVTIILSILAYCALKYTRIGLIARGTALGVSTSRTYAITFGVGAAVSGLAGGLLAPITGVLPSIGATYIAKAFITVISGGTAILAGTLSASTLLGGVNAVLSYLTGPTIGEVGLLVVAIVLLRLMPQGITARLFRRSL